MGGDRPLSLALGSGMVRRSVGRPVVDSPLTRRCVAAGDGARVRTEASRSRVARTVLRPSQRCGGWRRDRPLALESGLASAHARVDLRRRAATGRLGCSGLRRVARRRRPALRLLEPRVLRGARPNPLGGLGPPSPRLRLHVAPGTGLRTGARSRLLRLVDEALDAALHGWSTPSGRPSSPTSTAERRRANVRPGKTSA